MFGVVLERAARDDLGIAGRSSFFELYEVICARFLARDVQPKGRQPYYVQVGRQRLTIVTDFVGAIVNAGINVVVQNIGSARVQYVVYHDDVPDQILRASVE